MIMDFEAARSTAFELLNHHDKLSKKFLERADAGMAYTVDENDAARALVMACQGDLDEEMKGLGVLVCPSAPGVAPKGLDATGDPVFNRIWTMLGTPCVSVPGLTGQNGLPVGIQIVGRVMDDPRTLSAAAWIQDVLAQNFSA